MKIEYPKFVYWRDAAGVVRSKVINGPTERVPGMEESPALLPAAACAPCTESESTPVAPAVPQLSPTFLALMREVNETIERFYRAPAKVITDRVRLIETQDGLTELAILEAKREPNPRPSVVKAIEERMLEVGTEGGSKMQGPTARQ